MRVFRNRAEAEAAGFSLMPFGQAINVETDERAIVRSPLEHTLAEALEAVEWAGYTIAVPMCPSCVAQKSSGHADDCKLAAALAAFRGEG